MDPIQAFHGFDITRAGMRAEMMRAEVAATNLANTNTTRTATGDPYRRRTVVFEELLEQTWAGPAASGVAEPRIEEDHTTPFVESWDPGHPHADEAGFVLMPNVDLFREMVELQVASRSFQANLAAMRTYRGMLQDTLANFR